MPPIPSALTVFKLGGSLLDLPDVLPRLRTVIRESAAKCPLIVVGGGSAADLVRDWSQRFSLDPESAHWLAIQAMSLNARLLTALDSNLQLVSTRDECRQALTQQRLPVFDAASGLAAEEQRPIAGFPTPVSEALPRSWQITSDSIAAWLAARWQAEAIWLLKSVDLQQRSLDRLAACGAIDSGFRQLIRADSPIFWVNLRASPAAPEQLSVTAESAAARVPAVVSQEFPE